MTDYTDLSPVARRVTLAHAESTVFIDDLQHLFVQEDCGGDLNFHLFDLAGNREESFASLGPAEVIRLHDALSRRIAQYERRG